MSEPKKPVFGSEQERAGWAWDRVDEVARLSNAEKLQTRYGTLARKLPSYLQVNGVGQTLAFLFAKGKGEGSRADEDRRGRAQTKGDGVLLRHLRDRVLRTITGGGNISGDPRDVMAVVLALDPDQHRLVGAELAATATWLKRFAEGRLGEEEDGAGGDE